MMTNKIQTLLEAFYKGETTLEEEQILLRYFENNDVDEEFVDDRLLFLELYNREPIPFPPNLEEKLNKHIDSLETTNTSRRTKNKQGNKLNIIFISVAAVAASLALIFMISGNSKNGNENLIANADLKDVNYEMKDTYTDPYEAQKAIDEALLKVSTQFNRGLGEFNSAMVTYEKNIEQIRTKK